jgi:hypothetical protein
MFWRILPHATLCFASNRPILLDVRQDRYLMVPDPIDGHLREWLEAGKCLSTPASLINLLERSHVLREGDGRPVNGRPHTVATPGTLAGETAGRSDGDPLDAARVSALVAATWLALRCRPLQQILHGIERRQILRTAGRASAIADVVATYDRARIYVPFARRCLLDSLAMHAWLRRHRLQSQLVFGVTGQPFAAHCWLQNDAVILNDIYERISRFTPILAL